MVAARLIAWGRDGLGNRARRYLAELRVQCPGDSARPSVDAMPLIDVLCEIGALARRLEEQREAELIAEAAGIQERD